MVSTTHKFNTRECVVQSGQLLIEMENCVNQLITKAYYNLIQIRMYIQEYCVRIRANEISKDK